MRTPGGCRQAGREIGKQVDDSGRPDGRVSEGNSVQRVDSEALPWRKEQPVRGGIGGGPGYHQGRKHRAGLVWSWVDFAGNRLVYW
jgi:hypothetical protein